MRFNHRFKRTASGVMLLECIVYIGVFATLVGVAFAAFFVASESNVGLRRNADQMTMALRAGERWRADIRTSTGPATYTDSGNRTSWHIPQENGDVVYHYEEGSIWRQSTTAAGREELIRRVSESEMRETRRAGVKCYAWRLSLKVERKTPTVTPVFHFLATPNPSPPS